MERPRDENSFVCGLKDIAAGSVGGVLQCFSGHPFDTCKVRLQTTNKYKGMIHCFSSIIKEEGPFAIYKGVQSPLVGLAAINAVAFFSYGLAKELVRSKDEKIEDLSITKIGLAGGMAGAVLASIEGPVDFFKCQLQMRNYGGLIDCVRKITKDYGVKGAFQGMTATLLRNVPANATYFAAYEWAKRKLSKGRELKMTDTLLAGSLAGIAYWGPNYPIDVIKSQIQTDSPNKSERKYKSILQTIKSIHSESGLKGFYKGFTPCIIRSVPANAFCFLGFEFTKRILN